VPNIQYADDLTVCAESRGDLQSMLLVLNTSCTKWGMKINGEKTKVLSIGEAGDDHPPITLNGQIIEEVDSFSYLGSEVDKMGKVEKEVGVRLEKAATVYHMWRRKVFRSRILTKWSTPPVEGCSLLTGTRHQPTPVCPISSMLMISLYVQKAEGTSKVCFWC
jgi:hypothetical protein